MKKISKNETLDDLRFPSSIGHERAGAVERWVMLLATLVLPLAGTFALSERPAGSGRTPESAAPVQLTQDALPRPMLDEKN